MRLAILALAAATTASVPGAVLAQQLGGGGAAPEISVVRVTAALLLCLAVAFVAILLVRRRGAMPAWAGWGRLGGGSPVQPRIVVLESRRVSPHADVCLVRCGAVDYLILCGAAQAQLLAQHPADTA